MAETHRYALGWTQHSHGAQNIRTAAMIQLLCGNVRIPGGGVNALRRHSNVQGITDVGTLTAAIPGYLALPTDSEPTLESHLGKRSSSRWANQTSYWQNYRKFYVSFLKSFYGAKATPENQFGYDWLPKLDVAYDCLRQGFNPLMLRLRCWLSPSGLSTSMLRSGARHHQRHDAGNGVRRLGVSASPQVAAQEIDKGEIERPRVTVAE